MSMRISRPSPALIVAVIALILALAGSSYAAIQSLPQKSVGTKQLKANAVTGAKVKNQTLTGKKFKLGTIGTVPTANIANLANTVAPPVVHQVGAPGEPPFLEGAKPVLVTGPFLLGPPSFFKDASGIVHLEGVIQSGGGGVLFVLPPGFRPGSTRLLIFENQKALIFGSNSIAEGKDLSGAVIAAGPGAILNGITFRAES